MLRSVRMLTMLLLSMVAGGASGSAPRGTVIERRMELTEPERRSATRTYGPVYRATIVFRRDDGQRVTWKGQIEGYYAEEVLRRYDHFKPGMRVAIPQGETYTDRPEATREVRFLIGGLLGLMVLFFGLPILHFALGIHMWITHPVRLFAVFGLGALGAGLYVGWQTYLHLTTWPSVEARLLKGNPVALLDERGAEITVPETARKYIELTAQQVLDYQYQGQDYSFVVSPMSDVYREGLPCQEGETCRILVDPRDPAEIALPKPLNAEAFAGPLALSGFGLVFLLVGLLFPGRGIGG